MKAYGHLVQHPVECCPGHSDWAVQTKHNHDGPNFDRARSRRPNKRRARREGKEAIRTALEE